MARDSRGAGGLSIADDHSREARPAACIRHASWSNRSWPKKASPPNTIIGTPQWPAARWSIWFCSTIGWEVP
jgi:hypothetical protein